MGQTVYAGSNFTHLIQFSSYKEGPDHIVQNWPGSSLDGLVRFWPNFPRSYCAKLAQMAWSDFDQTHLVWLLPVSHFQAQLYFSTDNPDYTANMDPIWFGLTVSGLGQMDPVQKHASVQE